jgi:hypothetical protein
MSCEVKPHFTCDGAGRLCDNCGESEEACGCEDNGEEPDFVKCTECDGAGRFCVTHESPCGDMRTPPQCDEAKAATSPHFRPIAEKPCKACPFRRKALQGYLGSQPPEMFIANIMGEVPSPCHSSIDYEKRDWKEKWQAGKLGKLCTGASIMAANSAKSARNPRMLPVVPPDRKTVFATPQEFLEYHGNASIKSWEF